MKIGIDARFYGLKNAGLGRYTQNLVAELERLDHNNQYVIFLQSDNFDEYQPRHKNFTKALLPTHPYSIKSQLFDWYRLSKYKLDLIHFPHFSYPILYFRKFVITVHDLIKTDFNKKGSLNLSGIKDQARYLGYHLTMKMALSRSARIITATNYTKDELVKKYQVSREKIQVTYYGLEESFKKVAKFSEDKIREVRQKYRVEGQYLLYVGNAYPYKNVERLLSVFAQLRSKPKPLSELKLYLVCSRSVFYDKVEAEIKRLGLSDSVKMLGFVPDEDLFVLYNQALAYITATLAEGFGLTALEAMGCGCPVLSSNRSCLPEVYGEAALYFDPDKNDEIIKQINMIQKLEVRKKLIDLGRLQVAKYDWQEMANQVQQIYQQVKKEAS